jgi:hypothetical protein
MTHFAHSVPAGPHFHHLGGPQGNALLRNAKSALRAGIKQKGLGNFRCGNASARFRLEYRGRNRH